MSKILAVPLDHPGLAPRPLSPRLRSQLVYFVAGTGGAGAPPPGENEYRFNLDEVSRWLDDGVIYLVSPLDTANQTEVELSEEQEDFLGWLRDHGVRNIRVDD